MKRWATVLIAASVWAQANESAVRLTAPLNTRLNRTGDLVAARILEPSAYAGGYLEGEIKEIHGGAGGKRSVIQFQFHTLHFGGKALPVVARLVSISNSKKQQNVDEDGNAIEEEKGGALGSLGRIRVPGLSKAPGGSGDKSVSASPLARLGSRSSNLSLASGSVFNVEINLPASK